MIAHSYNFQELNQAKSPCSQLKRSNFKVLRRSIILLLLQTVLQKQLRLEEVCLLKVPSKEKEERIEE
jgi:hypothetical protein